MKRTVVLLVSAFALSACGGTDSSPNSATSKSSPPPRAEYTILSKSDLKAAVLPVQEMPTGYGEDPDTEEGDENIKRYCDYRQPFEATTIAKTGFVKGGGLSSEFIQVALRQYDDAKKAAASFKSLVDTMDTCKQDTIDGDKVTFSVLSMPDLEDASIGIATSSDDVNIPQFFVLAGPTMISVGGGGLMGADSDMLVDLLKDQIGAYKKVAKK